MYLIGRPLLFCKACERAAGTELWQSVSVGGASRARTAVHYLQDAVHRFCSDLVRARTAAVSKYRHRSCAPAVTVTSKGYLVRDQTTQHTAAEVLSGQATVSASCMSASQMYLSGLRNPDRSYNLHAMKGEYNTIT